MKQLATAPLILTGFLLGSCDTGEKVLGSVADEPAPTNPSGAQPPGSTMPPAPASPPNGTAPVPPPRVPPPFPPPPIPQPGGGGAPGTYPPGPYGYRAGQTLANYSFLTREGYAVTPDSIRRTSGSKVLLVLQTSEGCCPIVGRLNEINGEFAPQGLLMIQVVTHNRSGQMASAQTLDDWDRETGYTALSVYGKPMVDFRDRAALTPTLVVAHVKDLKIQTFAESAEIGGVDEIRAAVQAALASAP